MNRLVLFLFAASFCFSACGPKYIYNQSFEISQAEWTYDNPIDFTFEIQDTNRIYNLILDIEHSTNYSYQNIYTLIHTSFPSGEKIKEQLPINFSKKSGEWYGDCDNEWCTIPVYIQENAFFNVLGKHTISLEQFMRINPLVGIKSISFKVEDTGISRNEK